MCDHYEQYPLYYKQLEQYEIEFISRKILHSYIILIMLNNGGNILKECYGCLSIVLLCGSFVYSLFLFQNSLIKGCFRDISLIIVRWCKIFNVLSEKW